MKTCVISAGLGALLATSSTLAFQSKMSRRYPGVTSTLFSNIVSSLIMEEIESKDEETMSKLSRPERKALEREKKEKRKNKNHRKHNFDERNQAASGTNGAPLDLNSGRVLSKDTSTADDVLRAIKRAQNLHDVQYIRSIERFLLEEVDESFGYGYRGSLLARLAVAALHLQEHAIARRAMVERHTTHRVSMLPMESAAIIRGLLRVHNVTDALEVLEDELSLPVQGTEVDCDASKERILHRALSLGSIASRHFFEGEPSLAVEACTRMAEMGPIVRESGISAEELNMPWTRIIQGAAQCESGRRDGSVSPCEKVIVDLPCNLVYSALNAMTTFPSINDDRTYEALSNALVRRVVFVTGAVEMEGCPPADRGEAAFIGRSNVGKSSLVNMVTNRKSLAYTSKTPGKTQQFNFFAVNDKPDREKEIKYGDAIVGEKDPDSFNIVDLPGFGFAKVPDHIRRDWSEFMSEYITSRKTLRVLFHLVDARHGPTEEDSKIMKLVGEILPKRVTYVVVLTKADKNVKGSTKNSGKVTQDVMQKVRDTMKLNKVSNAPVILTSAETKLGRDDLWRFLKRAAEA